MLPKWVQSSSSLNYLLDKTLGKGTFSKVKLAVHKPTNEKVAIKIIKKSKILSDKDNLRISRELSILRILNSQYTLKLYEIIDSPAEVWIVCEYIPDGELYDYIVKNHRVKESESRNFFRQLIFGVEYLHSLGITHRDIKPENLFLCKNHLKIGDFGLSCKTRSGELLRTACGSPCFAAPEMLQGMKYCGEISDIWSCGVVLFSMLCGHLPFEDDSIARLYQKISSGDCKIPNFLTEQARDMIRGILEVDTKKRLTIAKIKQHPWFFVKGEDNQEVHTPEIVKGVVQQMVKLGIKSVDVENAVNRGGNQISTCYYLMLKKYLRTRHSIKYRMSRDRRISSQGNCSSLCYGNSHRSLSSRITTPEVSKSEFSVIVKTKSAVIKHQKEQVKSLIITNQVTDPSRIKAPVSIQPPVFKGMYNVNCLTLKPLAALTKTIQSLLTKQEISFIRSSFKYSCSAQGLSFTISISRLEGTLKLYLLNLSELCPEVFYTSLTSIL